MLHKKKGQAAPSPKRMAPPVPKRFIRHLLPSSIQVPFKLYLFLFSLAGFKSDQRLFFFMLTGSQPEQQLFFVMLAGSQPNQLILVMSVKEEKEPKDEFWVLYSRVPTPTLPWARFTNQPSHFINPMAAGS